MFEIQLTIISLTIGFLLGRAFPKNKKEITVGDMRKIMQEEISRGTVK